MQFRRQAARGGNVNTKVVVGLSRAEKAALISLIGLIIVAEFFAMGIWLPALTTALA